jgi:hypothetical protein
VTLIPRRVLAVACISLLFGAVLAVVPATPATASPFWVGPQTTIYPDLQMGLLGIGHWPDGEMGVERSGATYTFYAAKGGGDVVRTTGTLNAPAATQIQHIAISNVPAEFPYAAGGRIHTDSATGTKILVTHLERPRPGGGFDSSIGLARSTDGGASWSFLGEIIRSSTAPGACTVGVDAGSGMTALREEAGVEYLYIWVKDRVSCGQINSLAAARSPLSDVFAAAANGTVSTWTKYYNSSWTEPGIGGLSTDLWPQPGDPFKTFGSVSWNTYLEKYILVVTRFHPQPLVWRLEMLESSDGLTWSAPQTVAQDGLELFYPSIVGLDQDPSVTGQAFHLYYIRSLFGGAQRFWPADLMRRGITFQ